MEQWIQTDRTILRRWVRAPESRGYPELGGYELLERIRAYDVYEDQCNRQNGVKIYHEGGNIRVELHEYEETTCVHDGSLGSVVHIVDGRVVGRDEPVVVVDEEMVE